MPMVSTGTGAIDVMSKLLQDRVLMLNGQACWQQPCRSSSSPLHAHSGER